MKADQLYQELRDFALKLGVSVEEHNLRESGIPVRSGLCVVKGRKLFIMDKHKTLKKKIRILAETLAEMAHEELYAVPAVRELLSKHDPRKGRIGGDRQRLDESLHRGETDPADS